MSQLETLALDICVQGHRTIWWTVPLLLPPHDGRQDRALVFAQFELIDAVTDRVGALVVNRSIQEHQEIPVGVRFGIAARARPIQDDPGTWFGGVHHALYPLEELTVGCGKVRW